MFCRNCGKELSEGAVFCGNCGTAVSAAAPAPAETSQAANAQAETPAPAPAPAEAGQAADAQAETPAQAPAPAGVSQAADAQAETPAQAPAPVKKKKKKKGLAVAIVLLLLIAATGTAGFVLWNNNDFRCWLDVRQANKMYDAEDYASAVDTYLQALERVEDSSEAIDGLVQVAQAYEKEENYEDALAIYEQILALDSENQKALGGQRDCYLTLGNEALKQERYENALAHYEKVRKINKTLDSDEGNEAVQNGQLRAYMGLAKQNLADFKYDKAREYFDNVLADADRDSDLYDQAKRGRAQATLVLGLASFQTDDYKTAETYYREILDEESVGSRAYQALAELYVAKDDVEGAISILEEGTGLYDDGALREQLTALRESLKPVYDFTPLRDENGNVYDLGGMEITLRTTWFEEEASADSAYGEALAAWRQWVQETYNFTFRVDTSLDFDSMDDTFRDYVTGGGDDNNYVFDVAAPRPGLTDFLNGGLLYDVASLGCMDFNSPKYALNKTHELFTRGDAVYGFHAGYPSPAQGIYFNKRLLEQLTGMTADDLYDLQRNGQWTWSKFEEILEKIQDNSDVDGDGVTDVYGFGGSTDDWVTNIVFSNGGRWFDRVDGKLSCTAQDPRTTEGLAFAKKLMEAGYWYRNPDVDSSSSLSYEDVISAFRDEAKIVFLPERAYNMLPKGLFSKDPAVGSPAADDYGFLMFPKGDSADGHTNVSSETVCVIPACYDADRAWKIAFAYDQYFELVPGFEDHNPHLSAFHASVNDVRAVEETIARMCTEGCSVDYASILDGVAVSEDLQQFPAGKDAAALIKAAMPKWQKAADAANGR